MKRRIWVFLLMLAMMLPCMGMKAEAETSGTCGETVSWTFDSATGMLSILGFGDMYDYDSNASNSMPWYVFKDEIKHVMIADGVTTIGESAFNECVNLTSISIPNSVIGIRAFAFDGCEKLTCVEIPHSVTYFGTGAFSNTGLKTVVIPSSIKWINYSIFSNCVDLTCVTIEEGLIGINEGAFGGCKNLENIKLPGTLKEIVRLAFSECKKLRNVYYSGTQESIEEITINDSDIGRYTVRWHYEVPDATGHTYDSVITEPTCTEKGYTTHTCICGNSFVDSYVDALGHDYDAVVTAPTCTEAGFTTYTCVRCTYTYTADEVPATGHGFGDWRQTVAPTCIAAGTERHDCGNCDHFEIREIAATGHTHTAVVTAPTCTEAGFNTYTCHCGDTYTADEVPALGHSYESAVTEATCTTAGYTTHTCDTCGDSYTDDETEALGHDLQFSLSLYPATCTREGKDIHSCGRYRCYYSEVVTLEADGHDYEAVVTDPTCTEAGYTTYTCTCGHSYVGDEVEATGHFYETAVTDPTCTEAGYTTYTCECGESYVDDEVEATGHSYEAVVTDPTCTEGGYTTYTCACGDSYAAEETEPTGHSYEAVVTEPTCTEKGYTTYTCACGDSYTGDETEALGHDNQEGVCSRCGEAILSIVSQSQSVWVPEGQKVTVTVEAEGDGLTYKWYYKNPSESKYTYTSSFVGNTYSVIMNEDRDGRYVYCKITDSYGNTVKSKTVSINMQTPLEILTQPKSVRVDEGATAKVTVKAQGDGLTYKWYYKNPGATKYSYTSSFTGNSYSITMNDSRDGRYVYCRVYDKYGNFIKTNTVSLRMK